jgi:hypothetical protein
LNGIGDDEQGLSDNMKKILSTEPISLKGDIYGKNK